MADANSALPIRSELPGQVSYTDIITKIGDGTNPTTQLLGVDTSGRVTVKLDDGNGNIVTSQVNGAQRALDVGINVAGIQIDPRSVGQYNSTLPTVTSGSNTPLQTNINGVLLTSPEGDLYPATQAITAQDTASTSTVQFAQTWYSGSPTAGSVASFALSSNETGLVEITGTWTGTLQIEESVDGGTNWVAHSIHVLGSTIFVSSVTGNVSGSLNLAAKTNFRVRAISTWTGTATVKLNLSINASSIYVANAIKLVDGSSPTSTTTMNIVAGSTAASATNTAIVVGLSPNSPLPAGTNLLGSVNQGTNPWITSDLADGSVSGGTAGTKSLLGGGIYNSTPLSLTTGQQAGLQLDSAGNLKVNLETSIPAGSNTIGVVNQGTPNTVANAWPIEVTNGTSTAFVTPASTAALASNPALVVALSPNSPVPAGTNLIGAVNLDVGSAPVSTSNPVPVTVVSAVPGTNIQQYFTTAALAAGASTTFTYTVPATHTFSFERAWGSASGKIKVVVQNNGATIFAGFNSTATPNVDITVTAPPLIATGNTASIIITNLDLIAFDVYATIEGNQPS